MMTNQLKDKGHSYSWGEEQQRNFDKLKVAIAIAPILAILDPCKPLVVETDSSATTIDAILTQDGKPIAFESKKLNQDQHNYSTYEREFLLLSMLLRSGIITYMVPPLRYYFIMRVSNGLQVNVT